jgi:hypothetical protein
MSSAQTNDQTVALMESGSLSVHAMGDLETRSGVVSQVQVHRGMTVQTVEGNTVGHVAAVVLDRDQQKVTHLVLLSECQRLEYRLIPVELIKLVSDEKVLLRIVEPTVDTLAAWHRS